MPVIRKWGTSVIGDRIRDKDNPSLTYGASQTPAPNTIPVTGNDGRLSLSWLPYMMRSTFAYYIVDTSRPTSPTEGTIFYNTSTNVLEQFQNNEWITVPWQDLVRATREWVAGRLRISTTTGRLEISPDGTNWYSCYPLVGAVIFEITTLDNTSYTHKYYLPVGCGAIINNANHVPIVYTPTITPMFMFQWWWSFSYEQWVGLRPSNSTISNGDGQVVAGSGTSASAGRSTSLNIVPFAEQSATSENWGFAYLTIRSNQRWLVNSINQGWQGYAVHGSNCSGTAPSTSHWLGTWYNQAGTQFTAEDIIVWRLR